MPHGGAHLRHESDPFRLVTTDGGVRARTTGHGAQAGWGAAARALRAFSHNMLVPAAACKEANLLR